MTEWWKARHARQRSSLAAVQPIICRFADCDKDATDTVGTVALCALHRSLIDELLNEGSATQDRTSVGPPD